MPSSTDKLRKQFGFSEEIPGGGIDDGIAKAEEVIKKHGGTIGPDWFITLTEEDYPQELWDAVTFLREEWDYGLR